VTKDPGKPQIAVVAHAQAPYRLTVHRRIVHEMPEVGLWCLYTREQGDQPWDLPEVAETRPVVFGKGETMITHRPYRDAWRDFKKGGQMIRFLKDHQIRAVVAGGYADAARMRLIWWCILHRVPCFVTGDANTACDLARGVKLWVKKAVVGAVIRCCAGVLPWGRSGIQFFKKYGARDGRIWHFPYEPDYRAIQSVTDADLAAARRRFDLPEGRRRIVFCGRLIALKRVDLLIDAFASLADQRPDWDLVIVGDGELREPLQARVPERLRGRVRWCGFVNDATTIAAINRCCDAMALPGDFEQWGLVLNEGAACGLALVASNIVGAAFDLIEEGVNGRTHPPGDASALAACLLEVTDPARIDAMRAASTRVLADYRRRCDPISGLRAALTHERVIPDATAS
jgi:glycosyltransferase involved in cell wall biosynthesis